MFMTFEGLDFSGKSTQAKRLIEKLRAEALPGDNRIRHVQFIREPGGSSISERLREILLDRKNLELNDVAELLLFSASRAQVVQQVILPALQRGEHVLCDRYVDSTTAYQGYGRGLDLHSVRQINRFATSGLVPDVTILLEITPDEILRRKERAGIGFDRMENSGREFYERVRNGYREIAGLEPGRFVVVDGMAPVENVEKEIWNALQRRGRPKP
jgi:dTMP kinase